LRIIKIMLKRLTHRTDEKKIAERYIMNTIYKTEYKTQMLIYPIPDFIEDKHCRCPSCNNEGEFMWEKGCFIFCGKCLSNQFENPILTQDKVLIVPSVTQAKNGNAFEWNIQGKTEWYKIRGVNITCDSTQRLSTLEIKNRFDELMVKILEDNIELCDAEYDKDNKQLKIYV
jgi:ribosomal protein S27AE